MLLLVDLLEVRQRVAVVGIELEDVGECRERAVDEASAPVVQSQAEQDVGMFQLADVRPLQEGLVFLNRAADLALFAIQVAEDQPDLQRIAGELRRLGELVYRRVDLAGDEKIEAEDVMRRLAPAAAIDPAAVLELVALPCLADGEAREQRDQGGRAVSAILPSVRPPCSATTASIVPARAARPR